jgi:hypothetical protein
MCEGENVTNTFKIRNSNFKYSLEGPVNGLKYHNWEHLFVLI